MSESIAAPVAQKSYEGYSGFKFVTALNPRQHHFVGREGEGPWRLSLVDLENDLTLEEARSLMRELDALCRFIESLDGPELHRSTEPGEPDFEGRGGGL